MVTLIVGILALLFGLFTLYLRLFKNSKGLGKLEKMKEFYGEKNGTIVHVEVFYTFVSTCNTERKRYGPKLKGTKKCNLRFADSCIRLSSFYIIKTS